MVSQDRSGCVKGIWGRTEGELKVGGHEIKYGQVASLDQRGKGGVLGSEDMHAFCCEGLIYLNVHMSITL